ncbi:MAG: hypothetical protein ACYC99_11775, partial [Candidatus Geothermincolia bacterium]
KENLALKEKLDSTKADKKQRHFWRSFLVWILIILACVFSIAGTLSAWVQTTTLDTNTFVKTIAPLIEQEAVAKAVSDAAVTSLFKTYDIPGKIKSGLNELSNAILQVAPKDKNLPDINLSFIADPISGALEGVAKTAAQKILTSKEFASIWEKTLRTAHTTMVDIIKGKKDAVVTSEGDTVILNLSELLTKIQDQLVNAGLGFLKNVKIPADFGKIELFTSAQIGSVKSLVNLLGLLSWVLPLLALIFFVLAVVLAVDHRKALLGSGIGLAIAMLIVLIVLKVAHGGLIGQIKVPENVAAANVIWTTVLSGLKQAVWGLLVLGVVVAVGAGVSGPSKWATWVREHVADFFKNWRDRREGKKGKTPFSAFMEKYAWWFRIGGLVIAALILALLPSVSALAVIITVIVLAVYMAVIELVR